MTISKTIGKYCLLAGGLILGLGGFCFAADETIDYLVDDDYIYGSFPGAAPPNTVEDYNLTIDTDNGEIRGDAYAASVGVGAATVQNNTLTLKDGGFVSGSAYGGYGSGSVNNNSVTITGGGSMKAYAEYVYGGRTAGANETADGNTVTITGENVIISIAVYGGHSDDGSASSNHVIISRATIGEQVYGGMGWTGESNGNIVEIDNAKVNGPGGIFGGVGATGASENRLTISGDDTEIYCGFTAGQARTGGEANNNVVSISGGFIDGDGGSGVSLNGIANGNTLTFTGGEVTGALIAGNGGTDASNNKVEISGDASADFLGAGISSGGAENNSVIMTGGRIGGNLIAGGGGTSVRNNTVTMSDGQVGGKIYGGRGKTDAAVTDNTVSISGGNVDQAVYGGYAGYDGSGGDAEGNAVSVTGGTIGSGADDDGVYGGYSSNGAATGNTAIIENGEISGDVYGGRGIGGGDHNNEVYLLGGRITGGVYGGNDTKPGNTLYLHGYIGSLAEINSFENYSIILSDEVIPNDPTSAQITITGPTPTDLTDTQVIAFSFAPGSRLYNVDDEMIIIDSTTDSNSIDNTFANVSKGPTAVYDVQVLEKDAKLVARILGRTLSPYSGHFNQIRLASLTGLTRSGDLVANAGLDRAWAAASDSCEIGNAGTVFATADFSHDKLDDDIRMRSWSFLTGLGWRDRKGCDYGFLGAVFVETGTSDFWGDEDYSGYGSIRHEGDAYYYGAGLLARYRFENGFRIDGSARFGREKTKYRGKHFLGSETPRFNLRSNYVGLHVGVGYDVELSRSWNLDLSAGYQWLRLGRSSARILDEDIRFSAVNSHLARVGTRLVYQANPVVKPFVGVAYEYEFASTASSHNRTIDMRTQSRNLRGGTGIGELGAVFSPTRSRNLLIEASVRGHVGERKGFGCQLGLNWIF